MPHEIEFTDVAKRDFMTLDARWRSVLKSAILSHLRNEPTLESKSRIKRLRGTRKPQFRLRVDDYRIFYDVKGDGCVLIHGIIPKSKVAEWLTINAEWNHTDDHNPS